jgi:hypothetical protein
MHLTMLALADGGYCLPESAPYEGELAREDAQRLAWIGGTAVPYWSARHSAAYQNGIRWDGVCLAVLAHEAGHWAIDTSDEIEAWEAAAILFGAELVLGAWGEVLRGLRSYEITDESITALRGRLEKRLC